VLLSTASERKPDIALEDLRKKHVRNRNLACFGGLNDLVRLARMSAGGERVFAERDGGEIDRNLDGIVIWCAQSRGRSDQATTATA
jgi:hypothetical protein